VSPYRQPTIFHDEYGRIREDRVSVVVIVALVATAYFIKRWRP
jgi:hypothetical protein